MAAQGKSRYPVDEFAGKHEFAVGSIRGMRSFDHSWDNLHGVSHRITWKAGENRAICDGGWGSLEQGGKTGRKVKAGEGHAMGACSCGFYAYYDGSNDYSGLGRIGAVIEGYGKVVVGTKGFRAEKAKIVALCIPGMGNVKKQATKEPNPFKRLVTWLSGTGVEVLGVVSGVLAIMGVMLMVITGLAAMAMGDASLLLYAVLGLGVAAPAGVLFTACIMAASTIQARRGTGGTIFGLGISYTKEEAKAIIDKYGVPVYNSEAEMTADFPLGEVTA